MRLFNRKDDKMDVGEYEDDDEGMDISVMSGYDRLLEYMKKHKVVDRQKTRRELGFTETQLNRYQRQVMKLNNLEVRKNMMRPKHRTLVLIDD
ncbi:hypothetical protein GQ472_06170 [archaeon]|nr:hypothetical protein [archaeon]